MKTIHLNTENETWYMDNSNIALCNHRPKKLEVREYELEYDMGWKWDAVAKVQAEPFVRLLKYLKQMKMDSIAIVYNPDTLTVDVSTEDGGCSVKVSFKMLELDNYPVVETSYRSKFSREYLESLFEGYKVKELKELNLLLHIDEDYPILMELTNGKKMLIAPRVETG